MKNRKTNKQTKQNTHTHKTTTTDISFNLTVKQEQKSFGRQVKWCKT